MFFYSYLISMFFKKTTVAVLVGVLWYLISIMPYILIYNAEYVADVAVWKKVLMVSFTGREHDTMSIIILS